MSAAKDTISPAPAEAKAMPRTAAKPLINQVVDFLSSVRFGVCLLIILVVLSIIGMVIIQQNVQGFDNDGARFPCAVLPRIRRLDLSDCGYNHGGLVSGRKRPNRAGQDA